MFYIKRNFQDDSKKSLEQKELEIYLEVNDDGRVTREIELDDSCKVIHKYPSTEFEYGIHGYFDMTRFQIRELKNDLSKVEFEELWRK